MHLKSPKLLPKIQSTQGSSLIIVSILVVVASSLVATAMIRSQQAGRLANFSEVNADLRSAAEGELERCFFLWKMMKSQQVIDRSFINTTDTSIATVLSDAKIREYLEAPPLTTTAGYNAGFNGIIFGKNWDSSGKLKYQFKTVSKDIKGLLAGSNSATTARGKVSTYKLIVWATKKTMGADYKDADDKQYTNVKTICLGRTFTVAESAVFQNAIFYSGTIELTPGGTMVVDGDIAGNSDIYLAGKKADGMTVKGSVSSPGTLNMDPNFDLDIGFNAEGDDTTSLNPITGLQDYFNPVFATGRDVQAARATQAQSFLGGIDVAKIQGEAPTLFPLPNDVYHGIIDPPPTTGTDSPTMANQRMYNKAGLRIRVRPDGTVEVKDSAGTSYDSQFAAMFTGKVRKTVVDSRERAEHPLTPAQYNIAMTSLDVAAFTAVMDGIPALKSSWNGILYVHDSGSAKAGIRLVNGATTPNEENGYDNGFTVATNTGLYIQGDYNTKIDGTTGKVNRAVVMADAVTGLSNNWNDALSSSPLVATRKATDTVFNTGVITGDVGQVVTANGDGTNSLTSSSGGPHNLVRFLEDWKLKSYTLSGSLVQLFESKTYNSTWLNQQEIYKLPTYRYINFDKSLSDRPLSAFVSLTVAKRGDYFTPYDSEETYTYPTP